ncbi:hypothetical protein DL769_007586 [Monosporascus sp. CRB-8-3]|nr:hypothetical protein DL769_007586 [Monosporascus sp. CRB-8-3]
MKGGTVTAYKNCITAISERNTGGRIVEAEQLFNEYLRNGVKGLQQALKEIPDTYSRPILYATDTSDHEDDKDDASEEASENPMLIAMRAADTLDHETESLQPNAELDDMISTRRHSKSLPVNRKYSQHKKILLKQSSEYTSRPVAFEKAGSALHQPHEDEDDPFASHGNYLQPYTTEKQNMLARISPTRPSKPPTPAQTPPPHIAQSQNTCFYDLNTTNCRTAVDIQDSLRSLLGTYFVSGGAGHQQTPFPPPSESNGIWRPVFEKTGPSGSGVNKRRIDLILAIGAQEPVDDQFVGALSGALEKLDTKPDGITRSGRLNLSYLVANAMRTFSTQPSSDQALDSPFTDPCLLATLVIPFLETYMAVHSKTQFLLLEYAPEHLATVLAMQQLIGGDLLKVAGILDDGAGELRPGPSGVEARKRRGAATMPDARLLDSGTSSRTTPSFSKADFLLTSSATESEIATLISAVWKILVDRSPSYIPDGAPRISLAARDSLQNPGGGSENGPLTQSPLIESGIRYKPLDSAAVIMGFQRQSSTSASHGGGRPEPPASRPRPRVPRAPSPAKSSRSSIVGTIKKSSRRANLGSVLGRGPDVDDGSAAARPNPASSSCDPFEDDQDDDDEDGRFAAEERKYMPLFMRRRETRRGNSRKALKFLGLSTEE